MATRLAHLHVFRLCRALSDSARLSTSNTPRLPVLLLAAHGIKPLLSTINSTAHNSTDLLHHVKTLDSKSEHTVCRCDGLLIRLKTFSFLIGLGKRIRMVVDHFLPSPWYGHLFIEMLYPLCDGTLSLAIGWCLFRPCFNVRCPPGVKVLQ